MDLRQIGAILWKRKLLMATAVLAGVLIAAFSLYDIHVDRSSGHSQIVAYPRAMTKYESTVNLLVDLPDFAIGRSNVDSGRAGGLARTYAYLVTSDPVMLRLRNAVGPLRATTTGASTEGDPVFQIKVDGSDRQYVQTLAATHARIFRQYLIDQQNQNAIPAADRMVVQILGSPTPPVEEYSRTAEIAIVLIVLPFILAGGIAIALENLSKSKAAQPDSEPDEVADQTSTSVTSLASSPASAAWPSTSGMDNAGHTSNTEQSWTS